MKKKVLFLLILIVSFVFIFCFYFIFLPKPSYLVGEEVLKVLVTMDNGIPLDKIEVDLWEAGMNGPPNAGINFTNEEGVVIFNIPAGEYEIGFNLKNFPDNLMYPNRTYVFVEEGTPLFKTILIYAKKE